MSADIKVTDKRHAPFVYFDVELDDAGLNPYEFRIYNRIARRAGGGDHACTESLNSMAEGCQMSRRSVTRAMAELVKLNMITRVKNIGEVSEYALVDKSAWITRVSQTRDPGLTDPRVGSHRPTKKTIKKTIKKTREEGAASQPYSEPKSSGTKKLNPFFYDNFVAAFLNRYGIPYVSKPGDFVQLTNLQKGLADLLTESDWQVSVKNYFASPLGSHTLADLSVRYATFRLSALDKFSKPIPNGSAQSNGNGKHIPDYLRYQYNLDR